MIKTILVGAAGNDGDAALFAAALSLARGFGAHLDVLHVKLDAVGTAVAMTTDGSAGVVTGGLIERLEQDAAERAAKARESYTRFCTGAGLAEAAAPTPGAAAAPSAEWHVETGDEPRLMTAYGLAADLIVARRGGGDDAAARSTLEAVLLETGRPVLIPPPTPMPQSIDRVAIAWKPTPQAARAVALALPFLARAKEVRVVTVEEEAEEAAHEVDRLVRNLAWHGGSVSSERINPSNAAPAASLLAAIAGQADLLVMGGYGHSRLREWVFGGFTQHVLDAAPLPVLIAH